MRYLTLTLVLLCAAPAAAQEVPVADLPAPCPEVDSMDVSDPPQGWEMHTPGDGMPDTLMVAGQDTARVYSPGVWVCKSRYGQTYVSGPIHVVRVSDAIEKAVMRRITADRTSPWWVGNFDHPARHAALVIHKRDSIAGLEWAGLPTDSLWQYNP